MRTIRQALKRGRLRILVFVVLVVASVWGAERVHSMRDRAEVSRMLADTKSVCVGRFLVDLPTQAKVAFSHERIAGFQVHVSEETDAAFQARMNTRERDIAARSEASGDDGGLEDAHDLHIANMVGRTFVYGRSRGYLMNGDRRIDMESVSIETHGHKDGVSFSLTDKDSTEGRREVAEALLSRIRLLRENEVPAGPGFCIGRAVFDEPLPSHKTEHIAMHVGFVAYPEVAIIFSSMPGGHTRQGLLARYAHMDADASPDELIRVTKLRQTARAIHGVEGAEVLERVRELNWATTYGFMWEAQGKVDNVQQPFLSLELHSGISRSPGAKPVGSSLHQDAVLALWDHIASSIRFRPSTPSAMPTAQR